MYTILMALMVIGALAAFAAFVVALRAWLRLRRARLVFQDRAFEEISRLASRTTELEKNLGALEARTRNLPIQISELQRNLATLRILAGALGSSLRQVQKALSLTQLKTLSSERIVDIIRAQLSKVKSRST